jgi:hypothetical protein
MATDIPDSVRRGKSRHAERIAPHWLVHVTTALMPCICLQRCKQVDETTTRKGKYVPPDERRRNLLPRRDDSLRRRAGEWERE